MILTGKGDLVVAAEKVFMAPADPHRSEQILWPKRHDGRQHESWATVSSYDVVVPAQFAAHDCEGHNV